MGGGGGGAVIGETGRGRSVAGGVVATGSGGGGSVTGTVVVDSVATTATGTVEVVDAGLFAVLLALASA
ncbi:MAG: hypothetical protein WBF71_09895 [Microthrixaceae bacterium]